VRFEKLFLAVIMAPEIHRDSSRTKTSLLAAILELTDRIPVYKWAPLGSSKENRCHAPGRK
jgi:hypothetical protein